MRATLAACLLLAACGGGGGGDRPKPIPTPPSAGTWASGPVVAPRGNYSKGTALIETPDGLIIDIPQQGQGETHLTSRPMSLAGKHAIRIQGSVEMAEGAKLYPVKDGNGGACNRCAMPTILSLYFEVPNPRYIGEVDGDRWYRTIMSPIEAGPNFDITIPLDDSWGSVLTMTANNNPAAFASAIARAARVGICTGGGDGLCHGVYAVGGPVRLLVTDFHAE